MWTLGAAAMEEDVSTDVALVLGRESGAIDLCAHARDVSSSSIYVLSSILPPLYTYAQYAKEEPANKFNTRFCWVIYPTRWVTFLEGKATLSSFYFKFRYAKNCFALIDKLKKKINSTYDFHMGLARSGCFLGA